MSAISPRKRPRQARSRATVDAIITAAARVLVEQGYDRTTTNQVARVAGVSIGSLYQYFPNKAALVMAVVERHCEQMVGLLARSAVELSQAPLPIAVSSFIDSMVKAHNVNRPLHRVVVQQVMHLGLEQVQSFQDQSQRVVAAFLTARADEVAPKDPQIAAYVLVTAVEALVNTAMIVEHGFDEAALKDEIVSMVLGYLLRRPH